MYILSSNRWQLKLNLNFLLNLNDFDFFLLPVDIETKKLNFFFNFFFQIQKKYESFLHNPSNMVVKGGHATLNF